MSPTLLSAPPQADYEHERDERGNGSRRLRRRFVEPTANRSTHIGLFSAMILAGALAALARLISLTKIVRRTPPGSAHVGSWDKCANRIGPIIASALLSAPLGGFAHSVDAPLDDTPVAAAMRYCQTVGVRAAWGAQARFLGAPASFKYIASEPLQKMFMGDVANIHTDAIYVLEEPDMEKRRQYEESAFYGWKQADRWVTEGRERPEYEVLAAVFYDRCKQELSKE